MRAYLERRGLPIGPNDLVLASTALASGGNRLPHNPSEFRRIADLEVVDWSG